MSNIADYQDNMLKSAYMKACFQYRQESILLIGYTFVYYTKAYHKQNKISFDGRGCRIKNEIYKICF